MTGQYRRVGAAARQMLEKAEVLLLDKDQAMQATFAERLGPLGIAVTATDNAVHALQLAREKRYAVLALDADTPVEGATLRAMHQFRLAAPSSALIVLTSRLEFSVAVDAWRAGAADVLAKEPGEWPCLAETVQRLCLEGNRASERDQLLREVLEYHEQSLKKLIDEHRRAEEAIEQLSGSPEDSPDRCVILVVDDNPRTAPGLQQALGSPTGYQCVAALNGGEALDSATAQRFHIALVKENLPDLAGTMVSRTLRQQRGEAIVLLFAHPGKQPGYISMIEPSQQIELVPKLEQVSQLVEAIHGLRTVSMAKAREKRYLETFRKNHREFLKRYAELREKLRHVLPSEEQ